MGATWLATAGRGSHLRCGRLPPAKTTRPSFPTWYLPSRHLSDPTNPPPTPQPAPRTPPPNPLSSPPSPSSPSPSSPQLLDTSMIPPFPALHHSHASAASSPKRGVSSILGPHAPPYQTWEAAVRRRHLQAQADYARVTYRSSRSGICPPLFSSPTYSITTQNNAPCPLTCSTWRRRTSSGVTHNVTGSPHLEGPELFPGSAADSVLPSKIQIPQNGFAGALASANRPRRDSLLRGGNGPLFIGGCLSSSCTSLSGLYYTRNSRGFFFVAMRASGKAEQ